MGVHPLLDRYNPKLAIFAHDATLSRPGSITLDAGARTWGDYHPCAVEFFVSVVHLYKHRPRFDYLSLLPWFHAKWRPLRVTPKPQIIEDIAHAGASGTREWALDVAQLPSQSESRAWRAYGRILARSTVPFEAVVYGRVVTRDGRPVALQYWYLYVYNDFGNKHEGDWEMAIIELDAQGAPLGMALSAHMGVVRRAWPEVEKDGGRPVIYVARGSHAGYFAYRAGGYNATLSDVTRGLKLPSGLAFLKPLVQAAARVQSSPAFQRLPFVRIWRDHAPALPGTADAPECDIVRDLTSPSLREMPEEANASDPERWWRSFDGSWGSNHVRFTGRTGPDSPWNQEARWHAPLEWIEMAASSDATRG